jgi:hypothetical protein
MAFVVIVLGLVLRSHRERKNVSRNKSEPLRPMFVDDKGKIVQEYGAI